jgi:lincosamide nucleotidyltransferase A/C/D/E
MGVARDLSTKVLSSRLLGPAARGFSHLIAGAPMWSPFRVFRPLRSKLKGEVPGARVAEIVEALEGSGILCLVAGGWGVDALIGHQSRRHDDVDILVDDFAQSAPRALEVLANIGFRLTERHHQATWMPDQWTFEDAAASRVDLLSLDWDLLTREAGPSEALAARALDERLFSALITDGRISGRSVPCLCAPVQRLFHSRFEPRRVDKHDLAAMRIRGLV